MACMERGMRWCRLARTLVTSTIDQVALLEAVLHLRMEERSSYMKTEEVRMKSSKCEGGCLMVIEGNAKEYQIRNPKSLTYMFRKKVLISSQPTLVEEDGTTRTKKYEELSIAEKLQDDCDLKAINIVLQGLPPDVYAILNHHKVAKEIWDRVKLLMQGTKLSLQEKECLVVPMFNQGDDPIACLNKAMAFLTAVVSSRQGQSEGHMARQCTQPKRPRNAAWFKEKAMLAEAQEARQNLNEEQLAFLSDPGFPDGKAA
ncbi:hypothetical protein Tco_0277700 [Tanacetum coccineum]